MPRCLGGPRDQGHYNAGVRKGDVFILKKPPQLLFIWVSSPEPHPLVKFMYFTYDVCNKLNPKKLILSNLSWCPGVDSVANFMPDREISSTKLILGGTAITALTLAMVYAYSVYLAPASTSPLIVSIDGVDYPDSYFNESYDYALLRDKRVLFDLRLNTKEYAPPSSGGQLHKTVYEFTEWSDAWSVLESMETPRVVIYFTKWLANGTHVEVDERWYGSDSVKERNSDDSIYYYMGRGTPSVNVYFEIQRSSTVHYGMYELGAGEIVSIEKTFNRVGYGGAVWIYAVQISGPPYKAILIRFPG